MSSLWVCFGPRACFCAQGPPRPSGRFQIAPWIPGRHGYARYVGAAFMHPRRVRGPSCPLSSSDVFYKYIVVVVEGGLACGQLHFCQRWRSLSALPTLCTPPCSRCLPSGDKSGATQFSVDKHPVVPKLSPVLRTARFGGRKWSKTKGSATASCSECSLIDS